MIKLSSLLEFDGGTVSIGAGPRSSTVKKARKMLDRQASIYEDNNWDMANSSGTVKYLKTLYDKYGEDKTREFLTRQSNIPGSKGVQHRLYLKIFNQITKH